MKRTNPERSATTRAALLRAAQSLFASKGYSETSTEEILAITGLTRGALYHHFRDKSDLFASLCDFLHAESAEEIGRAVAECKSAMGTSLDILRTGCVAWLRFVSRSDVHRILIIDAPAVLGWDRWQEMDRRHGYGTLIEGVAQAKADGYLPDSIPAERMAQFLNGGMNQAVLSSATNANSTEAIARDVNALLDILSGTSG